MLCTVTTLLALAALMGLHLWWRRRSEREQSRLRAELARLKVEQQQATLRFQVQQEVMFDSMVDGLLLLDENGRIHLANRALMQLFDVKADIRNRTIMEALRLHELADLVGRLEKEKQVLGNELKLPGTAERWIEVNGAAIADSTGRRHGTVLVFHDLTRLKQLERTRKEFVANVSHELRTPLSLIKGYVETLLDGAKDNPEVATKFLHTIDRNAERLKLLIEDLLTISELESGRVKLNLQTVALQQTIRKMVEDFKTRAEPRKVTLVGDVPVLSVHADPNRLEQVLANLIDNAIKYGRLEGTITVSARALEEGLAEVCVRDDGPGIPPEALGRIFERFFRVDKARSREQGGTGLGLSIVKHIIQSHGGKVWATSEVGHGAAFYFTLPLDTAGQVQQPLL